MFHGDGDGTVRRQPNLLAFDIGDQPQVDEMMVSLVPAFAAVGLDQLDPTIFNAINGSNVDAVRANYFHMLFDISHWNVLCGLG